VLGGKTRVLVVDDSAFMRFTVSHRLSREPDIEVVGLASNGLEAVEQVEALRPDVVTLDVEMPQMDGLAALRKIMSSCPTPVVMLSTLTQQGAAVTVEALTIGAVDYVAKPSQSTQVHLVLDELCRKVRQAATARVRPYRPIAGLSHRRQGAGGGPARDLVVIGSSTGGPTALREVLSRLPANLGAAVLVVQHMPAGFTRSLAERLDGLSALPVAEAAAGDRLEQGRVLIAPGGRHLTLVGGTTVCLMEGPPVNGVRPSVDVTLSSVAAAFRHRALAVILTGMGHDGRDGVRALKQFGGRALVQDEATSTVFGMPRSVIAAGLADEVAPLDRIADRITKMLSSTAVQSRRGGA
jgi:two-component system chemotaxis response regulator CheB